MRAYCTLSNIYLTASVSCIDGTCSVLVIRPSEQPHASSYLIPFAYLATFGEFAVNLATATPIPPGRGGHMSSLIELYIQSLGSSIASGTTNLASGTTNLASVPIEEFSMGLQHVLNTYWLGSFDPSSIMGNLNPKLVRMRTASATNVVWRNVYRCRWGWWAAVCVCHNDDAGSRNG